MQVLFLALSPSLTSVSFAQSGLSQSAHDPEFIVPSRPTVSNPAEFQRPGVLQLESGYSRELGIPGTRAVQDMPLTLRFAASRRILMEFDLDGYTSETLARGARVSSVGDSQFGIQSVLHHENGRGPGIAVSYFIKAPTASSSKGLGTGRVDHSLLFLTSKTLGRFTLDLNGVYLLAGRTSDQGHASSGQGAFAVSYGLTRRFGLQGEISGVSRNDTEPGAIQALGAIAYQVNKRLVLDAGVRFGLSHDAVASGFIGGLTFGIANFYR
jgi:Putative MetA-pathway of phenol degradation